MAELVSSSKPRKSSTRKLTERYAPYIPPTRGIPVEPNLDFTQSTIGVPVLFIYVCRHNTKTDHFFVGSTYLSTDDVLLKHHRHCRRRTPRSAFYKLLKAEGVQAFSVEVMRHETGVFTLAQREAFVEQVIDSLQGVCLNEGHTEKDDKTRARAIRDRQRYLRKKAGAITPN